MSNDFAWTMPKQAWVWQARLVRVIDGDTLDVEIDVGFRAVRSERLRLWGINTPEVRGKTREAGLAAKAWTAAWLADATHGECPWPLRIETHQETDSFGRYLAIVWRAGGACLNHDLLTTGNAIEDIR